MLRKPLQIERGVCLDGLVFKFWSRVSLVLAAGSFGLAPETCFAQKDFTGVRLAVIAPRGEALANAAWAPLLTDLQKHTGLSGELFVGKDQQNVRDALVSGKADLAYLGNVAALEVFEAGKANVCVGLVRDDGSIGYRSIAVVKKASAISSIANLQSPGPNQSLALGDIKSTSGYIVPNYYLWAKKGLAPEKLFSKVVRGDHRKNIQRVLDGEVDVAITNDVEFNLIAKSNTKVAEDLKVIWQSAEIPESPIMCRTGLEPAKKNSIIGFLLGYGKTNEAEKRVLAGINGLSGFQKASNSRLKVVADIEMFALLTALRANKSVTDSERSKQEAEIMRRAAHIEIRLSFPD